MIRLVFVLFFLEVGFVLIVIPWLAFWDRNYFAQLLPPLHTIITNNFVRGAVSGLGVINVAVGVRELVAILTARTPRRPASITPSELAKH
ncbi:MAG: hypothetical protein A3I61_00870 [Acidobacteria bacterium RIFCSPLOWO2_02_FULL_68_18]|nr:MAG: hypothetical protein A3I61_00870 [Acidobacteria bacterium RIFCSPLOWO2_02_FULL_68_18]OFW49451.1 MAG: hypothetical protein A3G77_02235 [Acidobacteria bacterium RIFCSPLOWO2_12_FULL_68_19]